MKYSSPPPPEVLMLFLPPLSAQDDVLNTLPQHPQLHPPPCVAPCPALHDVCPPAVLHPKLRPLLVSLQPWRPSSALPCSLFLGYRKLTGQQEVHALPAGDTNLVFFKILSPAGGFSLMQEPPSPFSPGCSNSVSSALPDQAAHCRWFSAAFFWCMFHSSMFWFSSFHLVLLLASVSVSILGSDFH